MKQQILGLIFLATTAVIWTVSSFISGSLVQATKTSEAKVPPFLLTYLATTLFTCYLPFLQLKAWYKTYRAGKQSSGPGLKDPGSFSSPTHLLASSSLPGSVDSPFKKYTKNGEHTVMVEQQAMRAALWCTPLWFSAQFVFNLSLAYTSVTSNTILSSTSSLFTFGLSVLLLGEMYSTTKLLCILGCMTGTALVTLSDSESSDGDDKPVWGDLLVVISAALYATYTIIMRKMLPGEEAEKQVAAFFGYVGLFTTIGLAPVVVVLMGSGHVSLTSIPREAYAIILLEGLLDYVLADYLWARSVMLLGPTISTLGLSIQIPMAAGAELLMGRARWIHDLDSIAMTLGGTSLILAGFFGVNIGSGSDAPDRDLAKQKSKDSGGEDDVLILGSAECGSIASSPPLLTSRSNGAVGSQQHYQKLYKEAALCGHQHLGLEAGLGPSPLGSPNPNSIHPGPPTVADRMRGWLGKGAGAEPHEYKALPHSSPGGRGLGHGHLHGKASDDKLDQF